MIFLPFRQPSHLTSHNTILIKRLQLRCITTQAQNSNNGNPYTILNIPPGSDPSTIRAAYYELMKKVHPDVNASSDEDTTELAVAINAAYAQLMSNASSSPIYNNNTTTQQQDPFDCPECEPTEIFVNPFSCYVSPLYWRELQEIVQQNADGDPETALWQAGASPSAGSIVYLTPMQLQCIIDELERMDDVMDVMTMEVVEFYVSNCLARARIANARL